MATNSFADLSEISEVEEKAEKSFSGFRNYLTALSHGIVQTYGTAVVGMKRVAETQAALPGFVAAPRRAKADTAAIRAVLFSAWHTEMALSLPTAFNDPGLPRSTNQWAPVQSYYSLYSLWRGWFLTERKEPKSHGGSLKLISDVVMAPQPLLPWPWRCSCSGGSDLGEAHHTGFNSNAIRELNPLTIPPGGYSYEDWIAKTLRTTRAPLIAEKEKSWKAKARKPNGDRYRNILRAARLEIHTELRATTLFDFLWRIRHRSSYGDVGYFVMGQVSDADAQTYLRSLLTFTRQTMLVIEGLVRAAMPAGEFDRLTEHFLHSTHNSKHSELEKRLTVLQVSQ
jgi:hypothetical protein